MCSKGEKYSRYKAKICDQTPKNEIIVKKINKKIIVAKNLPNFVGKLIQYAI